MGLQDLLGDAKWFKTHFSQTIERGNDKHALVGFDSHFSCTGTLRSPKHATIKAQPF